MILDIGCGDGILTAKIAAACSQVTGLDSSPSFIETAIETVTPKNSNTRFLERDCRHINVKADDEVVQNGRYDKVFSNAAMHWILRDKSIRQTFFLDVSTLLKPEGIFAFEMGGAGNVAEVHTALIAVLHLHYHIPMDKVRQADPWFFPSDAWMRSALEAADFVVEKIELEHRPTKVTDKAVDGSGGLEGWVRLMGANFLNLLEVADRPKAIASVCEMLHDVVTRAEDGSQYIGYVRLRALARRRKHHDARSA